MMEWEELVAEVRKRLPERADEKDVEMCELEMARQLKKKERDDLTPKEEEELKLLEALAFYLV